MGTVTVLVGVGAVTVRVGVCTVTLVVLEVVTVEVTGFVARIAGELLRAREDGGVHEAADHDAAVLLRSGAHEGELSLVQEAHGRHESDRIASEATFQDGGPQVWDGAGDDHRLAAAGR